MILKVFLSLIILPASLTASISSGPPTSIPKPKPHPLKQNWGHVEVRPGANIFYWAIFREQYAKYPLVLWLQGGPGLSSSGVGNFMEVGPFHKNLESREYAWTKNVSLLFVDSPVGSGYSYVTNHTLVPKSTLAVANDLAIFIQKFYHKVAESLPCPLYVFGEGFGAKTAVHFVGLLDKIIKKKNLEIKLSGLALGDAWISPVGSVENYGKFLYSSSLIDNVGFGPIVSHADLVKVAITKGDLANATILWKNLLQEIQDKTSGVNVYNILGVPDSDSNHTLLEKGIDPYEYLVEPLNKELSSLMNGVIKEKLALPKNLTWGNQSRLVWQSLRDDMMSSSVLNVEHLLNTTKLPIMVYNGQLDLLVPSTGAEYWVQTMRWAGTSKWIKSKRLPLTDKNKRTLGYYKSYKNFSFYWILRAGHMVPKDVPQSSLEMLKRFVGIKT